MIFLAISLNAGSRINEADIEYLGAFLYPNITASSSSWSYGGEDMAFNRFGDTLGPDDGFNGSIFVTGHLHQTLIAEVTIPEPVLTKDISQMNRAEILQDLTEIREPLFGHQEIIYAGLEVLPPMGDQTTPKLHFCFGDIFQSEDPSHGMCDLDLSNPNSQGPWFFGNIPNYASNNYMCAVPKEWSDKYAPGVGLVTGRFREGDWSGAGPALFGYAPWNEGTLAANDSIKDIKKILLYGEIDAPDQVTPVSSVKDHIMMDRWRSVAYLSAGKNAAFVFCGIKTVGDYWYGFSDSTVYPILEPPEVPYPEIPDWPHNRRGWWSDSLEVSLLFYDTDELGEAAKGSVNSWDPQPYFRMNITNYFLRPIYEHEREKKHPLGGMAYDPESGHLYINELRADSERAVCHVFKVTEGVSPIQSTVNKGFNKNAIRRFRLFGNYCSFQTGDIKAGEYSVYLRTPNGRKIFVSDSKLKSNGSYLLKSNNLSENRSAAGIFFLEIVNDKGQIVYTEKGVKLN